MLLIDDHTCNADTSISPNFPTHHFQLLKHCLTKKLSLPKKS